MDNLFKQRFENFERPAPDHILETLLDKISEVPVAKSPKGNRLSNGQWLIAASVAIVATLILVYLFNNSPKSQENINLNQNKAITATENPSLSVSTADISSEKETVSNHKTQNTKTSVFNNATENNGQAPKQNMISGDYAKEVLQASGHIIANRSTCEGWCELKFDGNTNGYWKANKPVVFDNPNSTITKVQFSKQDKVLFTYVCQDVKDTFTVFFYQAISNISYQIKPEICGEENGAVIFNWPDSRKMVSKNTYELTGKTFERLTPNQYQFELEDQFQCKYAYKIQMRQENLNGRIQYQALEKQVDYPIYFTTDVESESADFMWNFGDGETSYERAPEHKYTKPGKYNVELEVVQRNCSETITLKGLVIKDRALQIPNIFSPNNDGKNDVFKVSVPEYLKQFEAYIMNTDGQLIYKWSDPKLGWDGLMMNGQEAQTGSYYYIIKGVDSNDKHFEYKSFLELVR